MLIPLDFLCPEAFFNIFPGGNGERTHASKEILYFSKLVLKNSDIYWLWFLGYQDLRRWGEKLVSVVYYQWRKTTGQGEPCPEVAWSFRLISVSHSKMACVTKQVPTYQYTGFIQWLLTSEDAILLYFHFSVWRSRNYLFSAPTPAPPCP